MRKTTFSLASISLVISIVMLCIYIINTTKSPTRIFKESLTTVVEVRAFTGGVESFGTAVILSDFELITNFHIVSFTSQSATYVHNSIEIRFSDSSEYQGVEIKRYDTDLDLALLVMPNNKVKNLVVSKSDVLVGQEVLLLGNGNNLGISLTTGVISRSEVEIQSNGILNRFIQVDATSTSGVSGGALLDKKGRLIGILTLRLLDNNGVPIYGYVYAIPISDVLGFIDNQSD